MRLNFLLRNGADPTLQDIWAKRRWCTLSTLGRMNSQPKGYVSDTSVTMIQGTLDNTNDEHFLSAAYADP